MQVYQRNEQALTQHQQEDADRQAQANQVFVFNPKAGKTSFRVLPPWDERGLWFHEIREHSFFAPGATKAYACTADSQGSCPVCDYGAALAAQNQEEEAKKFRASTKFLLNTIIFSDPSGKNSVKNGVTVMKVGATVKRQLLSYDLAVSEGYGDITDLQQGFDLTLERTGSKLTTKYDVKPFPQRRDLVARLAEEGIDINSLELVPLDQVVVEMPVADFAVEFENVMSGRPEETPVPVQATPAPTPVAKTTSPFPPKAPVATAPKPLVGGLKIAAPPTLKK